MPWIWKPWESAPVIWGVVINKDMKRIFSNTIQSLFKSEKCRNCGLPKDPNCETCNWLSFPEWTLNQPSQTIQQ